ADPNNVAAIEDIKFITRCDVFPVIAGEYTLRNAIERYYQQSDAQLQTLLKSVEAAEDLEVVEDEQDEGVKAQDLADDARGIKLKMGSRVIDFRVSTLPVLFGEKIVLRILDKGNLTLDLKTFGFEPKSEENLLKAILNPYGMVLVTGPTGSGKTTTLYSALSRINQIDVNIMTAKDPVEAHLLGIN